MDAERLIPEHWLKPLAIFMIYLVMSLGVIPLLSMRAEAVFQAEVYGEDQLPEFRRANDTTTVTVYADSNLVSLVGASTSINLTCTPADTGGFHCTYVFPKTWQAPGTYTLNLRQEGGSPPLTTAMYTVDGLPPQFNNIQVAQLGSSLSATYDIADVSSGTVPLCSGLNTLQLIVNQNNVATENFGGECQANGIITGEAAGLSGQTEIFLIATDRLGNTGTSEVITREVDTVAPSLPVSFELLRAGQDIQHISTTTDVDIRVTLRFTVEERSLDTVTVDASALTADPGHASQYTDLTMTCNDQGGVHQCEYPNLKLNPAEETIMITITATDTSGNTATGSAAKTLMIENTQPVITYLGRPDGCDTCFLTRGANDVLALLNAPGGMAGNGLFFKLRTSTVAARNCTNTGGDAWECLATVHATGGNGDVQTLQVLPTSMDDLGNRIVGILEKEFTIDNEVPQVIGQPSMDAACPVAGQTLTVTVDAHDAYSPRLYLTANVSEVTDRDTVTTVCEALGDGNFVCNLAINSFLSVYTEGNVPLVLRDEAGNTRELEIRNLEVCEAETEITPNFITAVRPTGTLPLVDKRIASLVPFRVVLPLSLSVTGGATVIQVRRIQCSTPEIAGPTYLMNEFSSKPVLVTHYHYTSIWPNGTVDMNCSLDFTMRRGNVVYTQAEKENLSVALPLTRDEIGNPGQAILDKDAMLVDEINRLQGKIGSKASIDESLGKICRMAEALGKINQVIQVVKGIIWAIALILEAWGYDGESLWEFGNKLFSGFHKFVNTYIWPVGWVSGGGADGTVGLIKAFSKEGGLSAIGYLIKWICGLYTCKLYDAGEWMSFGLEMRAMHGSEIPNWYGDQQPYEVSYESPSQLGDHFSPEVLDGSSSGYNLGLDRLTLTPRKQVGMSPYGQQLLNYQTFVDAIPGDDWIVNPYRSTRYDALCIPAQLYNLRKEKMLKCIELDCIRESAPLGMPITHCEQKYAAQSCLYLESAQAREHGAMENLLIQLGYAALQALIGWLVVKAYEEVCSPLYTDARAAGSSTCTGDEVDAWDPLMCGLIATVCGLVGVALNFNELEEYADSLREGNPAVPTGSDFCADLDGVEPDDTGDGGGLF